VSHCSEGLGETVEKQMVVRLFVPHHLLRNGTRTVREVLEGVEPSISAVNDETFRCKSL
jgi:hypothetical protein